MDGTGTYVCVYIYIQYMYIFIRRTNISIFRLLLHTSYLPSPYLGPCIWLIFTLFSSLPMMQKSHAKQGRSAANWCICPLSRHPNMAHSITLNHHTLHFTELYSTFRRTPRPSSAPESVCVSCRQLTPWVISPKYSHYDIVGIVITCYYSVNQMPLASPTLCRI